MQRKSQTTSTKTQTLSSCPSCGEPLCSDDQYCVGCGASLASTADPTAPSNPSGSTPLTRAETRAATKALTQYAVNETPCPGCHRMMGREERFCAGCGQLRGGLDPEKFVRGESKTEAAWREIQDRLREATKGRYEIVRELGRGGMAAVYLATEVALKRPVAIKVMRPSFLLDEGMVERFGREARTMAALQHPNIVTIHAVLEVEQLHFFVMQFIPGLPLDEVLRSSGPLPVAAVQGIMFQAATALSHAHRQGVIHRDIKPANIMLDHDGNAIVTDFGIAKVADVQATSATVGTMGTPQYMSPEQCSGASLTPASDQYSLGNVAYELLTGVPPFQRPTAMALGVAILGEKPKPIRDTRKDCPADVEAAILRMLAKGPTERFATLPEAMAALGGEALAEDDPVREFLRATARKTPRPDGRNLTPRASKSGASTRGGRTGAGAQPLGRRLVLLGAGAVALIAVAGWYFLRAPSVAPAPAPAVVASSPPAATPAPPPVVGTQAPARPAGSDTSGRAGAKPNAATARPAATPTVPTPERPRPDSVPTPAVASPAPAPAPAPAPPPSRVVDTVVKVVEAAKPHHEAEIRRALDEYVRAINARSIGQIRAIYPGLTGKQESDWKDRFDREIKKVAATMSVRSIDESTESAHAAFDLDLVLEPNGAAPITYKIRCEATLKNEGSWKISSLSERGS